MSNPLVFYTPCLIAMFMELGVVLFVVFDMQETPMLMMGLLTKLKSMTSLHNLLIRRLVLLIVRSV